MATKKISIIIPVYNREDTILRCVSSVLSCDTDHLEVVVVDDQSTDKTLSVLQSVHDKRVQTFQLNHKGNANVARNRGALEASGTILVFLDSDDTFKPQRIAKVLTEFEDGEAGIHLDSFSVIRNEIQREVDYPEGFIDLDLLATWLCLHALPITNSTLSIDRDSFWALGGFDEQVTRHQDRDFLLTACTFGLPVKLTNYHSVIKFQSPDSFSRSGLNYFASLDALVAKHLRYFHLIESNVLDYLTTRGLIQNLRQGTLFQALEELRSCSVLPKSLSKAVLGYGKGKIARKQAEEFITGLILSDGHSK